MSPEHPGISTAPSLAGVVRTAAPWITALAGLLLTGCPSNDNRQERCYRDLDREACRSVCKAGEQQACGALEKGHWKMARAEQASGAVDDGRRPRRQREQPAPGGITAAPVQAAEDQPIRHQFQPGLGHGIGSVGRRQRPEMSATQN